MRVPAVGICVSLAACSFSAANNDNSGRDAPAGSTDGPRSDASLTDGDQPHDGQLLPADAPLGSVCYGNHLVHICVAARPTRPFSTGSDRSIDTSDAGNCDSIATQSDQSELCVLVRANVNITDDTYLYGTRPLVIISDGDFDIDARLDATSGSGEQNDPGQLGPGANPASCAAHGEGHGGSNATTGGGGGGGGSFNLAGGAGGDGAMAAHGGGGGAVLPVATVIHGGCRGGDGGAGSTGSTHGRGGAGGGALYLITTGNFILGSKAVLDASGAPGTGAMASGTTGQPGAGGGGGGAGGMIGLEYDANHSFNANPNTDIFASGGGGGEGAGDTFDGVDGGYADDGSTPAPGGDGPSDLGGDGGAGGLAGRGAGAGSPGTVYGGGGGGGGGSGYTATFHP